MSSICTGRYARIGGIEQWIAVRGERVDNPGLFVIGGPGVALSRMAPMFAPWEREFTLLHWDQPGAGATVARAPNHGERPLSLARLVDDAITAIEFARDAFNVRQTLVLGYSGGSIVGLLLAHRRPDLICAYVGVGQFVDWRRQEARSYALLLENARRTEDAVAIGELRAIGPPPYVSVADDLARSRYASAMTAAEQAEFATVDVATRGAIVNPPANVCYLPADSVQQDPRELASGAYQLLRQDLETFDARVLGDTFGAAMYFFQGEDDLYAVSSEVERYAASIRAPHVHYETLRGVGHSALFMRERLGDRLAAVVRPLFP
jgi:pimeloyl-ACP methyl ester carboxylesterase